MNFYKSVIEHKGKLLVRGIHGGKDYKEKIDFGPTLYSLTKNQSKFKTLDGRNLNPIRFKKYKNDLPLLKTIKPSKRGSFDKAEKIKTSYNNLLKIETI